MDSIDINVSSPAIVIAGPTASGKSDFAIALCKEINGTVINFDSMQVYKELSILTARPDSISESIVPHKLYGYMSGKNRCSAVLWKNKALEEIKLSLKLGRVPILVGGSGLYIKTLIDGLSDIPITLNKYRSEAETILNKEGLDNFYQRLKIIDPNIINSININDKQRLIRAYTVWLQTGKSLSAWIKDDNSKNKIVNKFLKIKLSPTRDSLRENINKRFYKMIQQNVIEEVKKLDDFDESLPIMKAHGVRELLSFIRKEISLDEAAKITINHTNQYAKRQDTWFRHQYTTDYEIKSFQNNIDKYCTNILCLYKELY
ncbi:MAG: tRNA (adenosine(37)-N6)-dimethylallyltransferase MiaA [Pelagibacterales bacterium]|nr:tRNA (adenosine(37)-N6)-dimethylallyltransferase MiaA [Pelagibacterales bacterium]